MTLNEIWKDLSEKQKAIARKLKTQEELVDFLNENGFQLTEEQVAGVVGGTDNCGWYGCPRFDCGRYDPNT